MATTSCAQLGRASLIYPDWPVPESVKSVSTTRLGGFSRGAYISNNLALHVEDHVGLVQQNRDNLMQYGDLPGSPKWLTQIHGTRVVDFSDPDCEADASFSNQAKQVCAIMTADCLPILLCDKNGEQVAAIHAGWRGLLNGIIENTLNEFQGTNSEILVWLGPAIGKNAFEVGSEVYDAFTQHHAEAKKYFQPTVSEAIGQKYLADIYGLAKLRFNLAGVTSIFGGEYCTFTDEQRFYSYRRDGACGRMASLIWLDK